MAAEAKKRYNSQHRKLEFAVNDKVWLRTGKAYKPLHRQGKLTPSRLGLFIVVKVVNSLAYELDFPADFCVYPVVSIQYLLLCE